MNEILILERSEIILQPAQLTMLKSGWGKEAIEESVVEKMVYSSDGLKIKGFIAYPADLEKGKKYPCIIWNRGGFGNQGAIDEFTARGLFGQIASWGYYVFASQYRGNSGAGGTDEFGGGDVDDVLNLIPLASYFEHADTSNWAIEGWSRGGMMTYIVLTKTSIFKTAVISGGIADLHCNAGENKFMNNLYRNSFGKPDQGVFKQKCRDRSIINFPEKLSRSTPILLLHGTDDERVSAMDSIRLAEKLLELKFKFRLVLLEGGDHFLKAHKREVDVLRKNWFAKFLLNIENN